jgi:hypothetical protein
LDDGGHLAEVVVGWCDIAKARQMGEYENSSGSAQFPKKLFRGLQYPAKEGTSFQSVERNGDAGSGIQKASINQCRNDCRWWCLQS